MRIEDYPPQEPLSEVGEVYAAEVMRRLGATTEALTIYDLAGLRMGVAALLAVPLLVRAWPWRVRLCDHAIVAVGSRPVEPILGPETAPSRMQDSQAIDELLRLATRLAGDYLKASSKA